MGSKFIMLSWELKDNLIMHVLHKVQTCLS